MQTIRQGDNNPQVKNWQFFLIGLGYNHITADGDFGPRTYAASVDFQTKNGLGSDGAVGEKTYLKAFHLGYRLKEAFDFPDKPDFNPLVGNKTRAAIFGSFRFRSAGDGTEAIIITDDWESKNIEGRVIPQLASVPGMPPSGKVRFHKKGINQLANLFADWEKAGHKSLVLTWGGSYVPRFIRGSRSVLSNHSFGTAFDVNVAWNGLGQVPALVGEKGSVREMVKIAHKNGFYWGGHFSRLDGMHFEIAKLL